MEWEAQKRSLVKLLNKNYKIYRYEVLARIRYSKDDYINDIVLDHLDKHFLDIIKNIEDVRVDDRKVISSICDVSYGTLTQEVLEIKRSKKEWLANQKSKRLA